jgi:proteasome lid subunit RPN8/RPN11
MKSGKTMHFTKEVIEEIFKHAIRAYPYECCGIITGNRAKQTVHACQNIQNRLHAEDPKRYPGDARTAYAIDRREAEMIYSEARKNKEEVLAFYHSHTDHDAYFSEIDKEVQTVFGEPEYPDAIHIVVSVRAGKVCDMKCFKWDGQRRDFISIEGCI